MNQLNPSEFVEVEGAIRAATDAILAEQRPDGHWVYELEADATIPAEYVLLVHYLAETPNLELEKKIGVYLRRIQGAHGGWPLYHEGAFDISATVKAYFALKMIGDDIHAPHMARAREEIQIGRASCGKEGRWTGDWSSDVCSSDLALSGRDAQSGIGEEDRRLSAPHPGRPWRLAAVSRGRFRHLRHGESLFRAQDDRRRHPRAAYGSRPGGNPDRKSVVWERR